MPRRRPVRRDGRTRREADRRWWSRRLRGIGASVAVRRRPRPAVARRRRSSVVPRATVARRRSAGGGGRSSAARRWARPAQRPVRPSVSPSPPMAPGSTVQTAADRASVGTAPACWATMSAPSPIKCAADRTEDGATSTGQRPAQRHDDRDRPDHRHPRPDGTRHGQERAASRDLEPACRRRTVGRILADLDLVQALDGDRLSGEIDGPGPGAVGCRGRLRHLHAGGPEPRCDMELTERSRATRREHDGLVIRHLDGTVGGAGRVESCPSIVYTQPPGGRHWGRWTTRPPRRQPA